VPLLVSDLADWRKMYVEPGYAKACCPSLPDSISRALRWFMENPEQARQMGERGRQRILQEWNYETQFAPVLSELVAWSKPRDFELPHERDAA
jgi:glycosyltransferase involved in cell wall biosynthesis